MTATLAHPPKVQNNQKEDNTQKKTAETEDNLDLVRNILFGEQVKQTEERRMELERLLEITVNGLREETEKKFQSISQELSALVGLLTDETKARQAEFNHTRNTFTHLNHQLTQLDIKTQKAQSHLQENLINESSKTNQNIKRINDELSLKLEHAVEQLRHEKADRKAVAGLLSGVAKQLLDSDDNT